MSGRRLNRWEKFDRWYKSVACGYSLYIPRSIMKAAYVAGYEAGLRASRDHRKRMERIAQERGESWGEDL